MIALLVPPPHIADAGRGFKGLGVGCRELKATLHSYVLPCNQQLQQSALGGKTSLQAMKDRRRMKPELFRKQPYCLSECDS